MRNPLGDKDELKLSIIQSDCVNENCNDYTDYFEFEQGQKNINVKGRLKKHLQFWKDIGANSYILSVIETGYKIPFITTPPKSFLKNNKSAIEHKDFVAEAISELLKSGSVKRLNKPPTVVNPLTVAVNAKGKKRLVLDLRYVNPHIWKERIKFDDWKIASMYLNEGCYMFAFDLKSGYHHVEIDTRYQEFLGFAWEFEGEIRYFSFTVLPFGLPSAGHIFTKIV